MDLTMKAGDRFEQIKRKLIASGLFGQVYSAFNDFAGHGYHGVSVLRSYLGFNSKPLQVTGTVRIYEPAPHWARLSGIRGAPAETQEHGAQWHDDEIGVAGCLLSLVEAVRNRTEPTYGADQGRLDQELILALRMSALQGGQPIKLSLDPRAQMM
jgi:hypothetical protein